MSMWWLALWNQAAGSDWEVTCVSMGNPHAVVFVDDVDAVDLATVGPYFENHPSFPARINTEFVQVRWNFVYESIRGVPHTHLNSYN